MSLGIFGRKQSFFFFSFGSDALGGVTVIITFFFFRFDSLDFCFLFSPKWWGQHFFSRFPHPFFSFPISKTKRRQ